MKLIIVLITIFIIGCSNSYKNIDINLNTNNKVISTSSLKGIKNYPSHLLDANDPFESLNKRIYYFNYQFDNWIGLPAVNTYNFFIPKTAKIGLENFYRNLNEPITIINGILIFNYKVVLNGTARFIINSTVGLLGIFDVARLLNIREHKVTFSDTMSKYGVGPGPYLVLPFLGPSNLRNSSSYLSSFLLKVPLNPLNIYSGKLGQNIALNGVEALDIKSRIKIRYYQMQTPFEYEYVRLLYIKAMAMREKYLKNSDFFLTHHNK